MNLIFGQLKDEQKLCCGRNQTGWISSGKI
jgi:hypothetical protein